MTTELHVTDNGIERHTHSLAPNTQPVSGSPGSELGTSPHPRLHSSPCHGCAEVKGSLGTA